MKFEEVYVPENIAEIMVEKKEVNRPGLPLAGYYKNFEETRKFLNSLTENFILNSKSYLEELHKFCKKHFNEYKEIVNCEIDDWKYYKEKYKPLYNSLKTKFKLTHPIKWKK